MPRARRPPTPVGMHEAMEHGDVKTAREISDRTFPLTKAIYQALISSGILTS